MKTKITLQTLKGGIAVLLLLLSTAFTSCSGDDSNTTNSEKAMLIGSWNRTKVETRLPGEQWEDETKPCDLGITEEYFSDGDYAVYPGTNPCGSATVLNGTWELRAGNKKLVYTYNGDATEYESTIEKLDKDALILTHNSGLTNGMQYRHTYVKD